MKDSRQVRSEYQSFVDAYGKIAEASVQPEEDRKRLTKGNPEGTPREPLGGDRRPMVKVRKEGAFTEQAEKYQMSVKQFARFVEANQLLFSVDTRKKAQVANAFQGFKESAEWDDFFGDTVMEYALGGGGSVPQIPAKVSKFVDELPGKVKSAAKQVKKTIKSIPPGFSVKGNTFQVNSTELEGDALTEAEIEINNIILEVTTKETKSGTKYKIRVKHKDSGSSYVRYATREMIAQLRNDPKIASVEMTDEGDAPEDKGEKKALEKGGGDLKKSDEKEDTKRAAASGSGFAGKVKKRSVTTEAKKLDPVGKEDGDIDNDGDVDSSDKYLHKRRKAIGKAMMKKESHLSDWRQDLSEVMSDEDKKKTGKVKNKVEIMPQCEEKEEKEECPKCKGKGCEHCDGKGYHMEQSFQINPAGHRKSQRDQKIRNLATGGSTAGERSSAAGKLKGPTLPLANSHEPEGETLEEGPAALAIRAGLAAGTAIAGTKIGQEAIKKVRGMVQKRTEAQKPYMDLLNKGRGQ